MYLSNELSNGTNRCKLDGRVGHPPLVGACSEGGGVGGGGYELPTPLRRPAPPSSSPAAESNRLWGLISTATRTFAKIKDNKGGLGSEGGSVWEREVMYSHRSAGEGTLILNVKLWRRSSSVR